MNLRKCWDIRMVFSSIILLFFSLFVSVSTLYFRVEFHCLVLQLFHLDLLNWWRAGIGLHLTFLSYGSIFLQSYACFRVGIIDFLDVMSRTACMATIKFVFCEFLEMLLLLVFILILFNFSANIWLCFWRCFAVQKSYWS